MLRYSYEWVDPEGGEPHWSDELYAIYDSKLGYTDPFAWAYTRDDAERIVVALNAAEEQRQRAEIVWQLAKRRDQFDLSDLLS